MLGNAYRLPFRLLGIPILLDISFLIILPLLAWMIGSEVSAYVMWFDLPIDPAALEQGWLPYVLGLAAALGLFGSVIVHELGHSVVGRYYGAKVKNITLWILGGMAQFETIPRQPGAEAVIAIAGPVTSYLLGALCWLGMQVSPPSWGSVQFVLAYLTLMNVVLATFNLLPALPLDGGRILRSLLALRLSHFKATQTAAAISKLLAFLLGLLGFLSLNIFLMLIAFFVYMGVTGESRHATVTEMLQGIRVRDLMTREVRTVPPDMRVGELIEKMLAERHMGYPVVDGYGEIKGIVTLADIQRRQGQGGDFRSQPISDVLSSRMVTIRESASALRAFEKMSRNNFERLIAVDAQGEMTGIISKTDLIRAIQVRTVGAEITNQAPPRIPHP